MPFSCANKGLSSKSQELDLGTSHSYILCMKKIHCLSKLFLCYIFKISLRWNRGGNDRRGLCRLGDMHYQKMQFLGKKVQ